MPHYQEPDFSDEPLGSQIHRRLADDARGMASEYDDLYEMTEDGATKALLAQGITKALDFLNDIQSSFYGHQRYKALPLLTGDSPEDEREAIDRGIDEEYGLNLDDFDDMEGAEVLDRRKKVLNAVKAYLDDLSPDDLDATGANPDDIMGMMRGDYGGDEAEDDMDLGMGMGGGRKPFSAPDGKEPRGRGKPLPKKLHAHKCRKDLEGVSEELDDDPQTKQLLEDIASMLEEFLSQGAPSEPTFQISEEDEPKLKDHKKHLALAVKKYNALDTIYNYRRGKQYHDEPGDDQEGMEGLGMGDFNSRLGKALEQQAETTRQLQNMTEAANALLARFS
jgi:hypothetical protein